MEKKMEKLKMKKKSGNELEGINEDLKIMKISMIGNQ